MFLPSLLLTVASTGMAPTTTVPAPVAVASIVWVSPHQDRRAKVTAEYHKLTAEQNAEGLKKLWKENEGLVLQTIDADLEGSLSLWEAAKDAPPKEEIAELHKRALFGAKCASQALSRPIFLDYAASFVGWTDEQKGDFRTGQKVYGRAMQELKDGNAEVALEAAKETVLRAAPLGDWWGAAMGYGGQGSALQQMGELEDALKAYSQARLLNADLGLQFSEYRNLQGMLSCCRALERWQRGLATAESVVEYAEAFGDEDGLKDALRAKKEIEGKLGMKEAAEKTDGE